MHRDFLFNRKYGLYSYYKYPNNVLGPILFYMAIFTISYKLYKSIYEFIYKLIFTPDVIHWFDFGTFREFILSIDPKIDLLIVVSLFIFIFFYYLVMRFFNYNYFRNDTLKKILAFLFYMFVFNWIYIYVYTTSIYREIKREKLSWGTK